MFSWEKNFSRNDFQTKWGYKVNRIISWFSLKTFYDCYFAIHWINSNTCCWLEFKDAQGCWWQFFSVCKQWHIFEFDDKCIMTLNSFYFINTYIKWSVCQSLLCKKLLQEIKKCYLVTFANYDPSNFPQENLSELAKRQILEPILDRQSWTFKPK